MEFAKDFGRAEGKSDHKRHHITTLLLITQYNILQQLRFPSVRASHCQISISLANDDLITCLAVAVKSDKY